MEFLAGETLGSRLQRESRLPVGAALPLLDQMAGALDAAHRAGVIHRDFKPSNVMLVPGDGDVRAVVTDFGLARRLLPSEEITATLTGTLVGTLDYMAPELLTGSAASAASDVYALGTVAFRMVAGELPFPSDTPLAGAILRSKGPAPSPRAHVPGLDLKWEAAILRALDPDPRRRFSRASHFVQAIRGETASVTLALPVVTRRRALLAAVAAAALAAGGIAWRSWIRSRSRPSPEAAKYYSMGTDDIHAGAYFAATKALDRTVRLAPHFSLAHARLAEAWLGLDSLEKAQGEMILALREDNSGLDEAERLQITATQLTITREFSAALATYKKMRRLDSKDAYLDLDLGRAYENAGQQPAALESYRRAAEGPSHNPAAWLRLAILYGNAADWAKATEAFRQAEDLYQATSNLEGLTEVAYQLGFFATKRGHQEEAAVQLGKALEAARRAGNIQQEIRVKLQLSTNSYSIGDDATAQRYSQEALETARANQMGGLAIRGLVALGNAYGRRRDFNGAEEHLQEALALARRSNNSRLTALCLISLASLHDQLKRSEDSSREAQEALTFYQTNHYITETLQCLTMLVRAQRYSGDYPAALDSAQRLLQLAQQAQVPQQVVLAHESIGNIMSVQERYPEALEQYQQEVDLKPDAEHIAYGNLGSCDALWRLGRYAEARDKLSQAQASAAKFAALRLNMMSTQAEMSLSLNLFRDAAATASRALASETSRDLLTTADFQRILGLALLGSGNRTDGLRNCEESLAAATKGYDAATTFDSRLAVLIARLENHNEAGARSVFHDLEPALAAYPESRWRALALMAGIDRQFSARAREALADLAHLWGDAAYRTYLERPDVQKLSRLVLNPNTANH
jgi:tetratricopeptide (TPR) repeat protein